MSASAKERESGRKNKLFSVEITGINPDGNGVGRLEDGMVVFVPLTAPGDRVQVRIIKETKTYAIGRPEELLRPSQVRKDPGCPVYQRCGGCVFRHLRREAEHDIQRELVVNAFQRIGHLDVPVEPTVSVNEERYRNKVVYPLCEPEPGRAAFGYYARHSHAVVEHTDCPLQDGIFARIAMFHVKQIVEQHVPVWNEKRGTGVLRHLMMRKNRAGEVSVCMVAAKPFPQAEFMAQALLRAFPEVIGVSLNLNPEAGNTILGRETRCLVGEPTLRDHLCGKRFSLSPTAFYQVNAACAEELYRKAAELAAVPENGVLLDLYCGAGTVGLTMVNDEQKLFGVEVVPEAVENARKNASDNGRTAENTQFVCGDASLGVQRCTEVFGKPDVIVVDPPRKGLSPEVISTLLTAAPERIVYISCNPATLAANCASLCDPQNDVCYHVVTAIPFDMFPSTGHVETVALLERMELCDK
ncbi:MAG: 23S rRNA (uracil(1939)-C(5))-methyltransferase RlmD [Oscillospiraceae bacterium]|nr:23S rRNA (uracil(1939)-C(5))-methyltransferase RlmD [Oscillospiraceae bacterium]